MRRTPYTDRYSRPENKNNKDIFELLAVQPNKEEIARNGPSYLPSKNMPRGYNIQNKFNKHPYQRPLTVTRAHSDLKNRSQDKQTRQSRWDKLDTRGSSLRNKRYDKDELSLSRTHKQLLINTTKQKDNEHFFKSKFKQQISSKGKIYRGSSWKGDEKRNSKKKITGESLKNVSDNRSNQNSTPPINDEKMSTKKSFRNSGLTDILSKNAKQAVSKHKKDKNDDYFEYIMRFSYRTKKGSVPSNPDKVNQDSYVLSPNINKKTWQHFFAVCDGHGPLGHHVSSYIKNTLPTFVMQSKYLDKKPAQSLMKAFESTYQKMIKQSHIDMAFSGSTIISCFMAHNKIYCANVGDSRAIVGRKSESKQNWSAVSLSEDHKPSLTKEAQRIKKMNGRIQSYMDQYGQPIGPLRVWLKDENVPGLAMTRSFGDLVGASVGVSPVPQIKQFTITKDDRIILIASDGVFQFLTNQEIMGHLGQFYDKKQIQQASDFLLSKAHQSWSRNSSIVDDITFILIFLTYEQV